MLKKLVILSLCSSAAWAQRGGSVRYSGGGFQTASGTPVRYQAPANMGGGLYQNRYQNGAAYSANRYNGAGASTLPAAPVRYQAPVNLPVGSAVGTLPVGYRAMAIAGTNYYYYGGSYYAPDYGDSSDTSGSSGSSSPPPSSQPTGYKVVAPPLGASVDSLPVGAQEVSPGLYQANGVKYRPCFEDGKVMYVVSN